MNQEKNKKLFRVRYIILGASFVIYVISIIDAIYASIHDLYAMFISLLVNVPFGIILAFISFILFKKDLTASKQEKLFSLFGVILALSTTFLSITWFLFWKNQLGY